VKAMTPRAIVIVSSVAVCGAALWVLLAQGRQVSDLQAEQNRLESARVVTNAPPAEIIATPTPTREVPRELLQLRAEVARLSQQQRELAGTRAENEKLRSELENRRTNSPARKGAAYIRASEAKWLGYNTPEDTLQSLFWAAQNRNQVKFLEGLTPEAAEDLNSLFKNSDNPEEAAKRFFEEEGFPSGFRIIGRDQVADGAVALKVEVLKPKPRADPGVEVDSSEQVSFQQIAGQWKMSKPH